MEIVLLPAEGRQQIDTFSVAHIDDPLTFAELYDAFRNVAAGRAGKCFLSLDSLDQCVYTSMHAVEKHDMDDELTLDVPEDEDPEQLRAYDVAKFKLIRDILGDPDRAVGFDSAGEELDIDEDIVSALVRIQRNSEAILEEFHVVQCLPTSDPVDLLANIPNGYFDGDIGPFGTVAVARRMLTHGYELFGIGARLLGFIRTTEPTLALVEDLKLLYRQKTGAWEELLSVLADSRFLFLGYTQDFPEVVE